MSGAGIRLWPTRRNAENRVKACKKQGKRMVFCARCDRAVLERHKCVAARGVEA